MARLVSRAPGVARVQAHALQGSERAALSAPGVVRTEGRAAWRAGTPLWVGAVDFLGALTGLQCLALDRTHLAPPQLAALAALTGLTSLALADTALDDAAAARLTRLTGLRALDVSFTPLRGTGAALLVAAMPRLAVLNLDGCVVSSLGIWRVLRLRRALRMWPRGANRPPATHPARLPPTLPAPAPRCLHDCAARIRALPLVPSPLLPGLAADARVEAARRPGGHAACAQRAHRAHGGGAGARPQARPGLSPPC